MLRVRCASLCWLSAVLQWWPRVMTSHVLRVVLQTGHKLFDLFALKADLVDRREQGKPAEDVQVREEQTNDSLMDNETQTSDLVNRSRWFQAITMSFTHLLTMSLFWRSL